MLSSGSAIGQGTRSTGQRLSVSMWQHRQVPPGSDSPNKKRAGRQFNSQLS